MSEVIVPVHAAEPNGAGGNVGESIDTVNSKIASGLYKVVKREGKRIKSEVWQKFGDVLANDGTKTGFVACLTCNEVRAYSTSQGTNGLKSHKCPGIEEERASASCTLPSETIDPTPALKKEFLEICVDYCATDLKSFQSVAGLGFRKVVQTSIDYGAQLGRVNAKKLIPAPESVSRNTTKRADEIRLTVIPGVKDAIGRKECAMTTDMWYDKYHSHHYSTVTVHYFDAKRKLVNRVLFTAKFPDTSATSKNVREELLTRFSEQGITAEELKNVVFVTDAGSNIVKALEDFKHEFCLAHKFNRVLANALYSKKFQLLSNDAEFENEAERIRLFALKCRNVHLKTTFRARVLRTKDKDKQFICMLQTILENYTQINRELKKVKQPCIKFSKLFLSNVISLLQSIKKVLAKTGPLNAEKSTALLKLLKVNPNKDTPHVQLLKNKLYEELIVSEAVILIDSCKSVVTFFKKSPGLMGKLPTTLKAMVETRWNSACNMMESVLSQYDEIFEVLRESGNLNRFGPISEKKVILTALVEFLKPFKEETERIQSEKIPTLPFVLLAVTRLKEHCEYNESDCPLIQSLKKKSLWHLKDKVPISIFHKLATFLYPSFRRLDMIPLEEQWEVHRYAKSLCKDIGGTASNTSTGNGEGTSTNSPDPKVSLRGYEKWRVTDTDEDEVEMYLRERVGDDSNLLEWWKSREDRYPLLARVARQVLVIPATSASSERNFSVAGITMDARRTSLHPEKFGDTLYLNNAFKVENQ